MSSINHRANSPAIAAPPNQVAPPASINEGICARCGVPNPHTKTHCTRCGARLPWLPAAGAPPVRKQASAPPPVKMWPFWAGEPQKKSTIAAGLEDFYPTQWCLGSDKKSGLAIDESSQTICLLTVDADQLQRQLFSYNDLLGSEVIEDGYIVSSTSGSSGSSRGGQGNLPQGLSQRLRTGQTVDVVAFKLVLNAITGNPSSFDAQESNTLVHIVKFVSKPTARGSAAHQAALEKADHWHRLILAFLHIEDLKKHPLPRAAR